jgi:hypothetical protein
VASAFVIVLVAVTVLAVPFAYPEFATLAHTRPAATTPLATAPSVTPEAFAAVVAKAAAAKAPTTAPAAPVVDAPSGAGCVLTDLGGCISGAVDSFLQTVLADALNPLLGMLSDTLLTTPSPTQLPGLRELWNGSWQIVVAIYGLFVVVAGILLMGYESVQTRYSMREIAPRITVGFLAGALSLTVAGFAVDTANALAQAVLDLGVDPDGGAVGLRQLLTSAVTTDSGAVFLLLLGLAIVVGLVAVLLGYVVRVMLTVVLIAGAPIALMFHALPQTEGIARWWWRTFAACLAIQVVQSLTLITALNLLLQPGRGFSVFTEPGGPGGPPQSQALPTMLAVLALLFILYRIPFWLLAGSRVGHGRSLIGSIVRGFIAYRALGLLRGRSTRRPARGGPGTGGGASGGTGGAPGAPGGGPRGGPSGGSGGPRGSGRGTGPGRPGGPSTGGGGGPGAGPGRPGRRPASPGAAAPRPARARRPGPVAASASGGGRTPGRSVGHPHPTRSPSRSFTMPHPAAGPRSARRGFTSRPVGDVSGADRAGQASSRSEPTWRPPMPTRPAGIGPSPMWGGQYPLPAQDAAPRPPTTPARPARPSQPHPPTSPPPPRAAARPSAAQPASATRPRASGPAPTPTATSTPPSTPASPRPRPRARDRNAATTDPVGTGTDTDSGAQHTTDTTRTEAASQPTPRQGRRNPQTLGDDQP